MGTQLHQALRSLCFDTDWKYAVFWKFKHRTRMMLTWEDAYYDNHEQHNSLESKCPSELGDGLCDWHSRDPLGLAVAKMSYHVYSLGEGVVGHVAITGKHMWIFADKHITGFYSTFEHCDGWQAQFSAGIKTVVAVAIGPYGVIQLGSLNKVPEDLKLVNHMRELFFALQDLSMESTSKMTQSSTRSSLSLSDISRGSSSSGIFHGCLQSLAVPTNKDKTFTRSSTFQSAGKLLDHSYAVPMPENCFAKTVATIRKHEALSLSTSEGEETNLIQSRSEISLLGQQKQVGKKAYIDWNAGGDGSSFGHLGLDSEDHNRENTIHNVMFPVNSFGVDIPFTPSDLLDSALCNDSNVLLHFPEPLDVQFDMDYEKNVDLHTEFNTSGALNKSFKYSAGCELYEALGPAFQREDTNCDWEAEKIETETATEIPEGTTSSSLLTAYCGSEHLLEAVVASVRRNGTDGESEKSVSKAIKSLSATEKLRESTCDKLRVGSASCSFDQSLVENEASYCLSSEVCGVRSSKGFSSPNPSTCSGQLERSQEPAKIGKKRSRPGESSRPRPRDRQLIQDRIKELRELVPNGSKCSIDSLLERTIKHMLFLQNVTKHADKLSKCAESKLRSKEDKQGLHNYEQGSSWAVEVGNHLKVCSIMVENINMNGQMLIEMLCEECSQFLDIAEAIRSLGLTILKGATECCGEKIWMCFVVEGQSNRSMHRMDVLWSLVQILQSKITV